MQPKRPIRLACLGDWSNYFSYFLYGSLEGAILNQCWFRPIDIRSPVKVIVRNILEFRPDILLAHMLFSEGVRPIPETLDYLATVRKKVGTRVFYHLGDARTVPRYAGDISMAVDGCLVNQTNLTPFEEIWKVPCYHWPYAAFKQARIAGKVKEFEHPLIFTGRLSDKGIHRNRTIFIRELQRLMPVKVYPDEKYPDTKLLTAEIAASATAILGVCAGYDIPGYADVRPYQYPGAGGVLFQRYYLGLEEIFLDGKHMIFFYDDDPSNFEELYNKWVFGEFSSLLSSIRQEAFSFLQRYHTYANRIKDVLNIVYYGVPPKIKLADL